LAGADRALRQLRERVAEWSHDGANGAERVDDGWDARFKAAISNDLDLPSAMALVAELTRAPVPPPVKGALLRSWDRVLGLDLDRMPAQSLPDGVSQLLESREKARAAKDFATSDRLRDELARAGVMVTDTPTGQKWKVAR
jgi:cysteinyl-tRNA synthetase